jgi:hypothetical protein
LEYDDRNLPPAQPTEEDVDTLKLLHPELDAYTVEFEDALLDEIRDSYHRELATLLENPRNQYLFQGGQSHRVRIGESGPYFALSFESYPLLWFSNNNAETYAIFRWHNGCSEVGLQGHKSEHSAIVRTVAAHSGVSCIVVFLVTLLPSSATVITLGCRLELRRTTVL